MQRTAVFLSAFVLLALPAARAQMPPPPGQAAAASEAQPTSPPPTYTPPPPGAAPQSPSAAPFEFHGTAAPGVQVPPPPAPPPAAQPQPATGGAPAGQWTYTQQYGWIWIPYDRTYTVVQDDSAIAYEYVYYPAYGWRWVLAPWVLGFGPVPYWGPLGPVHFAWYAHPWFRVGIAHLRPSWGLRVGPGGFRFGGHFHHR